MDPSDREVSFRQLFAGGTKFGEMRLDFGERRFSNCVTIGRHVVRDILADQRLDRLVFGGLGMNALGILSCTARRFTCESGV